MIFGLLGQEHGMEWNKSYFLMGFRKVIGTNEKNLAPNFCSTPYLSWKDHPSKTNQKHTLQFQTPLFSYEVGVIDHDKWVIYII